MTTSTKRAIRQYRRGAILDAADVPPDAKYKGTRAVIDGQEFCELTDGRLVRMPKAKNSWVVRDGRVQHCP